MTEHADTTVSRRGFLIATGVAALAAGLRTSEAPAQAPAPIPGKERLIVRSPRPLNLETRLPDLDDLHTPESVFYVRNNYDGAPVDPAQWSLRIEGEVDNPVVLRMDDLRKLPMITQEVTLECAGNGRAFHTPRATGIQWEYGAVGNARWRGVRLADVLALARPRRSGDHVAFDGADKPPTPQAPDFIRSVPMWKAQEPHTMIALEMFGKPIPHLHGGPARALVPGFVGSASIKWLERIMVLPEEFDGPFMKRGYRAPRAEDEKDTYSLQSLEVKSLIVKPAADARLPVARTKVSGWAWSGEGELTGVDVSTDGGRTWKPAQFVLTWDRYSWRKWEYDWDPRPGAYTLMARATDSLGRIQPMSRAFNPQGYRWNVIHSVKVEVV
jgi:DMSO/TMAO reductase YedYZ molybdopterin-dependent catalytic subunit